MMVFDIEMKPPTPPHDVVWREVRIYVDGVLSDTRLIPIDQELISGLRAPTGAKVRVESRDLIVDPCPAHSKPSVISRGPLFESAAATAIA